MVYVCPFSVWRFVCRVSCIMRNRVSFEVVYGAWHVVCYVLLLRFSYHPTLSGGASRREVGGGAEEIGVLGAKLRENFKDHAL